MFSEANDTCFLIWKDFLYYKKVDFQVEISHQLFYIVVKKITSFLLIIHFLAEIHQKKGLKLIIYTILYIGHVFNSPWRYFYWKDAPCGELLIRPLHPFHIEWARSHPESDSFPSHPRSWGNGTLNPIWGESFNNANTLKVSVKRK